MIRPIVKMEFLLSTPSAPATIEDVAVAQDLLDTLVAHEESCVGLAANMIGVRKCVIAFVDQETSQRRTMLNPEIVKSFGPYTTEEGCLSLVGKRSAQRFRKITVKYQDTAFAWHEEQFSGFTAQTIQHEIDHCKGVVI